MVSDKAVSDLGAVVRLSHVGQGVGWAALTSLAAPDCHVCSQACGHRISHA